MLEEAPQNEPDEEQDGKTQADALTVVNSSGQDVGGYTVAMTSGKRITRCMNAHPRIAGCRRATERR